MYEIAESQCASPNSGEVCTQAELGITDMEMEMAGDDAAELVRGLLADAVHDDRFNEGRFHERIHDMMSMVRRPTVFDGAVLWLPVNGSGPLAGFSLSMDGSEIFNSSWNSPRLNMGLVSRPMRATL
jgi:hypothetical protein